MKKAAKAFFNEFRSGQGLKGQLLRGGFWSLGIKLLSTLMSILLAIVLARLLGAEGYGIYSFIFALVSILAIPAQLGLPNLVVRETAKAQVAERWDVMKGLWHWASSVALIMSLILIVVGVLAGWILADKLTLAQTRTLWWGLALVPLVALGNLRGAALRGLRKIVQGQLPEFVLRPALFILLAIVAAFLYGQTLSPADAMMLHVVAGAAAFAIGALLLLKARPLELSHQTTTVRHARLWMASALPLSMVSGMQIINQNMGLVILGLFQPPEEVSVFRIAIQGATLVSLGLSVINLIIAPYVAQLYAKNSISHLQRLLTAGAAASCALAVPFYLLFLIFGREILYVAFGHEYDLAYLPLIIISSGQLVNAFCASAGVVLNMTRNEKDVLLVTTISTVINAGCTLLLAPTLGASGAAIAATINLTIWNVLLCWRVLRRLGLNSTAIWFSNRIR